MRPRGFGERIDASDPDLQGAARDSVEQLSRVRAQQRQRMHMVGEASVADLDALRQADDVERPSRSASPCTTTSSSARADTRACAGCGW
jgi:hypothetical protein